MERLGRVIRNLDPRVLDWLVAVALSLVGVAIAVGRDASGEDFRLDDALGIALVLAQTLPLGFRRAYPIPILIAISTALVLHSALGYQVVQAGTFSSLIAVYGAASLSDRRGSVLTAGITAAAIAGFYITNREDWAAGDYIATSATWAMAWFLGVFVRLRGQQAEAAGARVASLEREQEVRAQEAVADERARMARELHDIVGHALNVIVIQASGARRALDARPEATREALSSIESAGREALVDMERMLGVLRAADQGKEAAEPQPGLALLGNLVAHVTEAGIPVEVSIQGDRGDVPASVDLSAFRIVQESLTNSLKHSGASQAKVIVRYGTDDIEVEIIDNGDGSPKNGITSGGRGQLGMRERVALFGGELRMGANGNGPGYRVKAKLPFRNLSR